MHINFSQKMIERLPRNMRGRDPNYLDSHLFYYTFLNMFNIRAAEGSRQGSVCRSVYRLTAADTRAETLCFRAPLDQVPPCLRSPGTDIRPLVLQTLRYLRSDELRLPLVQTSGLSSHPRNLDQSRR